jgi:Ca-activated chloride channel family protein
VSFAAPLVLLGLLALPALGLLLLSEQRRAARARAAFLRPALTASVLPRRAGARRPAAPIALAVGLALIIAAAARPRHHVRVPVKAATVMLANDVSDSMAARDVSPSRLGAAQKAATAFTRRVPATIAIGSLDFARSPDLLQPPSRDHALARAAIASLKIGGGGTAIGEGILTGLGAIATAPRVDHREPPGAIILLSDGTSNVGVSPLSAAATARRRHVRIFTIAVGTPAGTIRGRLHGRLTTIPVPVNPSELAEIAAISHGHFYRAPDAARAGAIYALLARRLGFRTVWRGLVWLFAAAGLVFVVIAGGLSLTWFGELG